MLLVHQTGSVKVGEVVRYTLTYTPAFDRVLPSPTHIHVKIKNSSATPLRAAYLHGPYTLHVSTYPSTFNPNQKTESPKLHGVPEFEPYLKAGGQWTSKLVVPEDIRESGEKMNSKRNLDGSPKTMKWIIEISSQILFSNNASVNYELLVGRDERSLDLGFAAVAGKGHGEPGTIQDFKRKKSEPHTGQVMMPKGVYARAIELVVEDTAALWDKPGLPRWEGSNPEASATTDTTQKSDGDPSTNPTRRRKPKKVHLVILTHGLHSNVGADMLYLKESIDAAAKLSRAEAKKERKAARRGKNSAKPTAGEGHVSESTDAKDDEQYAPAAQSGGQDRLKDDENEEDDSEDEQVVVRGFSGNACRTDKGIQYLGKRLAKFVLTTTYPDQPFLPESRSMKFRRKSTEPSMKTSSHYGTPVHRGSSIHETDVHNEKLPYTFTSISFIGHSLGGLVQTYAVAYIHKHAPNFFKQIKPVNFVAMATPFLGLSNENPLYVKFALDFGLIGRTGQDLGLTWRAPNIARSGWKAVIEGLTSGGNSDHEKREDPRAKPLLRILPTGPAHQVLKMFRNRTVYANVVNDGIVPLRTGCLLFLDWAGLDRVQNARRENGLISTVASFGWAELTGVNASSHSSLAQRFASMRPHDEIQDSDDEKSRPRRTSSKTDVPQPAPDATRDDYDSQEPTAHQFLNSQGRDHEKHSLPDHQVLPDQSDTMQDQSVTTGPLDNLLNFFRSPRSDSPKPKLSRRASKPYRRAQTLKPEDRRNSDGSPQPDASRSSLITDEPHGEPPPKTSFFESAGDLLNPPLPPVSWFIDPSSRSRTIFHDRVYHPDDIPPPPPQKRPLLTRKFSSASSRDTSSTTNEPRPSEVGGGMRVEEKIARAYHHDLSWRKVLVRLEPDAHNNMVVRRIFANAYGWDVIKHVCDTHFAYTDTTMNPDEQEPGVDRARPFDESVSEHGDEVRGQTSHTRHDHHRPEHHLRRTASEDHEATDYVADLETPAARVEHMTSGGSGSGSSSLRRSPPQREDSARWSDSFFEDGGSDDDDEGHDGDGHMNPFEHFQRLWKGGNGGGGPTNGNTTHGDKGRPTPAKPSRLPHQNQQSPLSIHTKQQQQQMGNHGATAVAKASTSTSRPNLTITDAGPLSASPEQSPLDPQPPQPLELKEPLQPQNKYNTVDEDVTPLDDLTAPPAAGAASSSSSAEPIPPDVECRDQPEALVADVQPSAAAAVDGSTTQP